MSGPAGLGRRCRQGEGMWHGKGTRPRDRISAPMGRQGWMCRMCPILCPQTISLRGAQDCRLRMQLIRGFLTGLYVRNVRHRADAFGFDSFTCFSYGAVRDEGQICGSSLAPSVSFSCLPAPAWAAGLSPPHHVLWHLCQSQGRQQSLGTDTVASLLLSLHSPQPAVPMGRDSSPLCGASCDVLLWGAVFGGLKGYSGADNRTP